MTEQEILKEFQILEVGSRFIADNFSSLQKSYGNRFVAIRQDKILVSSGSFLELVQELNLRNVRENEVIVQFIPAKGEIILY
jgi:hypothetical protein